MSLLDDALAKPIIASGRRIALASDGLAGLQVSTQKAVCKALEIPLTTHRYSVVARAHIRCRQKRDFKAKGALARVTVKGPLHA